jgi:hypothetical protein
MESRGMEVRQNTVNPTKIIIDKTIPIFIVKNKYYEL